MAIRKYKPTTPGRRGSSVADFAEITRSTPEKSLVRPLPKKGGRNNSGKITTRHKGGGHKRQYRLIDFRRHDKDGVNARVAEIEYDPNRTARIALLHYIDGTKRYIIAPNKLKQGDNCALGVLALSPSEAGALTLPYTVDGVDRVDLDGENLLHGQLDLGLVGAWVDQEGVLSFVDQAVALLRHDGCNDDVARILGDGATHLASSSVVMSASAAWAVPTKVS